MISGIQNDPGLSRFRDAVTAPEIRFFREAARDRYPAIVDVQGQHILTWPVTTHLRGARVTS